MRITAGGEVKTTYPLNHKIIKTTAITYFYSERLEKAYKSMLLTGRNSGAKRRTVERLSGWETESETLRLYSL